MAVGKCVEDTSVALLDSLPTLSLDCRFQLISDSRFSLTLDARILLTWTLSGSAGCVRTVEQIQGCPLQGSALLQPCAMLLMPCAAPTAICAVFFTFVQCSIRYVQCSI